LGYAVAVFLTGARKRNTFVKRLSGRIALAAILALGAILTAPAAPIYTCGFEPAEGFFPGDLDGQAAWSGVTYAPSTVVQTGVVHDGVQAVQATAEGSYDESFWWKVGTFAVATTQPEVTVSQYLMISHANEADWLLTLSDATEEDSAGVWFSFDGSVNVEAGGDASYVADWEPGVWYNVTFAMHYTSGTFDVYLDGSPITINKSMNSTSSLAMLDVFCDDYIDAQAASLYYDSLVVSVPPGQGDANDDGVVDDRDASILGAHWRQTSGANWEDGDFNNDRAVDDRDAAILAAHWNAGPTEEESTVPEPSVLVLLLGAAAAWLARERRRKLPSITSITTLAPTQGALS
jgi:hypothetical protein